MDSSGSSAWTGSNFFLDSAISYSARNETSPATSFPGALAPFANPVTRFMYQLLAGANIWYLNVLQETRQEGKLSRGVVKRG